MADKATASGAALDASVRIEELNEELSRLTAAEHERRMADDPEYAAAWHERRAAGEAQAASTVAAENAVALERARAKLETLRSQTADAEAEVARLEALVAEGGEG